MTQNAYLKLLRQYASLARRTGQSFAAQVRVLENLRAQRIATDAETQQQQDAETAQLFDMTDREYAGADPAWTRQQP